MRQSRQSDQPDCSNPAQQMGTGTQLFRGRHVSFSAQGEHTWGPWGAQGGAWPCMIDTIHHVDETGPQVKSIILKEDFCFQNVSYQVYAIVALGFPGGSEGKESACNEGDQGSIPGSGRLPGKENGYPLRYFCLENSTDRGGWWATVHGVTEGRTQ